MSDAPAPPLPPTFTHPIESTATKETFSHLSYEDIFLEILPAMIRKKRDKRVENLKTAGATSENIMAELEAFDEEWEDPGMDDFQAYTGIRPGKIAVVKFAYDKANPGAKGKLVLAALEIFEVLNKLLEPFGYAYVLSGTEPPQTTEPTGPQPLQGYGAEDKADAANPPPPPLAYGQ